MTENILLIKNPNDALLPTALSKELRNKTFPSISKALIFLHNKITIGIIVFWEICPDLEVLDFAISPEKQNQRFGTKLLEELLSYAKEKRFKRILLEVNKKNKKALHIYQKAGFKKIYERKKYYNGKDTAFVMEKNI